MSLWIAITYIIGTMVIAIISPFWGLVGLIGSILIRFQDRFLILDTQPTYVYMCLACFIGFIIHKDKLGKGDYWPDKYWLRFFGWVCIGLVLMAPFTLVAQLKLLISSMVLYYLTSRCIDSVAKFKILFFFVTAISVGMGYEATMSFLYDENSPFAYVTTEETRMVGLGRYDNANEFGALMVMPLAFVLCLILLSRSIIMKCVYFASGAFLLYATGLTYSRTCMAIVGIMAIVVAGLWGKGNVVKKAAIVGIVGFGLVSALTVIPGPLQSRFMSILNYNQDASFQGRQRAWDQGFIMARSYPIFGVGMSQWFKYHGRAPHNSFVQAMAETGYPGILLYIIALFYSFKLNLRVIEIPEHDPRYNRRNRILAICLTANLVGYCVYAFFGNQAYTPFMFVYSGLCAAMANLVRVQQKATYVPPLTQKKNGRRSKSTTLAVQQNVSNSTEQVIDNKGPRFPQAPL